MQTERNSNSNLTQENLLSQILVKYMPYWPLFLVSLLIAVGLAYFYLSYATPQYEATATLIIKDEKRGNDDSDLMGSLNLTNTKKIIENEIQVLQSRTLMDEVVTSLHLYAPVYEEGTLNSRSAYFSSPVIIQAFDPASMRKTKKVYLNYDPQTATAVLDSAHRYPLDKWVNTPYGRLQFTPNPNYRKPAGQKKLYFNLIRPKEVTQNLIGRLTVSASNKLSTVVDLEFRDEVPERAEEVLNGLIAEYNNSALNDKNSLASNTQAFVENRLNTVAQELATIEKQIQQYRAQNSAIDISTQGKLFLENVSTNDQKLSEINIQMAVLDQVEGFVLSKDNSRGIVPSTLGISDPVLSQLLEKLYNAELEHERLKKTVAENNPLLVSISDQIIKIKPNILANIQSQRKSLQASKKNLSVTNSSYNTVLQSIPQKERQLLEISREQSIKKDIYSFLLQKREESAITYASTVSDMKVVDKAQASLFPVSPKSILIYGGSVVAAFLFMGAFIAISEAINRKVLYRQDIQALTSLPVIGEIAFSKSKSPFVVEEGKRTFNAEGFRKLRISLSFLGIGANHKKILVTSSIPGEGKSFVAANLALTIAFIGKRVALVDADLNNPSLGRIFETEPANGVSQFLLGQVHPKEIITQTAQNENLFFVPTGQLPENPSELLLNGRIEELFNYLEKNFDVVIIDTAPVVPVSDAYILSPYCNTTLYVVRHNYTPKMLLKRLQDDRINPLTNPAIIFNGVQTRGYMKNEYGYGYGYEYNYQAKKRKPEIHLPEFLPVLPYFQGQAKLPAPGLG